ncbi:MAG: phenylacetate--CoA ligase [Sedimentisphaerales bacterium]|nr:phenylacetate--CoA ligase [Sedimentisphaerales bacterium]HNY78921.1 phenylacetate--CoA ligase [Sedimentisphaerales bacterium]HOC62663.1 phenylacetate--CoA ligase [Sedimentisphaerales bacterium]HOH64861.1 phenylacetate--CoA ligase [Sedimentisphaerales bacterium]HPY48558.1 phenylacetate--CoA ligase [Sedimentisphaerales bacterium]
MDQTSMYNAKCETLPRNELEQLQFERLQSTLNRAYRNVAFYKAAFDTHCVNLERIRDIQAMQELPFTTKEDLQKSYPYDMFAVPLRDIVRIHTTSGTATRPIVVGYTQNDLRNWRECAARLLTAAGVTQHDVVQIALHYSLFAEGFGFHQGAERVGASVIPASLATSVAKQIVVMRDFKTTVLISTPSHALNIAVGLDEEQVRLERLSLRLGLFGGERWSDSSRRQLEERLRITSIDTYGPTEVLGPGVAGECHLRHGLHINEDQFIVEVINPKTLAPVAAGEEGELVVTTILKEGFPLIRYRTCDITRLNPEPCACGRTFLRMAPVSGRTDDLILVRGVGFFPAQIEEILSGFEGVSPYFQIILDQEGGIDTVQIRVEISGAIQSVDRIKALETLRVQIAQRIATVLDVEAKVILVEPGSLRQLAAGAERVVDRRP